MFTKNLKKINILEVAVLFYGLFFAFSARALNYPTIFGVDPFAGPGEFISYMYMFAAGTVGILAMASFVYAGVQYILSAAKPGLRSLAKERIMETLVGLGLIMGATTLFYTINPALIEISEPAIPEYAAAPLPQQGTNPSAPLGATTLFFNNPPPSASSGSTPPPSIPPVSFPATTGQTPQPIGSVAITPPNIASNVTSAPINPAAIAAAQIPGNATTATYNPTAAQQASQAYVQQGQQSGILPPSPPTAEFTVKERASTALGQTWDNIEGTNIYCPSGPDTSQCTAVVDPVSRVLTSYTCPPGLKPVLLTCDDLIGTGGNTLFQNMDFLPLVRSMQNKGGSVYITDMYHGCTDCGWYDVHFTFVGVSDTDKQAFLSFFYNSSCTQLLLTTIPSGPQMCVNPASGTNPCSAQFCSFSPATNQVYAASNSITLAWTRPNVNWPVSGYSILRYDENSQSNVTILNNVLRYNFTDSGLSPSTSYSYTVIANSNELCWDENSGNIPCSAQAMTANATTLSLGSPAPSPIQQCAAPNFCRVSGVSTTCSTHPNQNGPVHYTISQNCVKQ